MDNYAPGREYLTRSGSRLCVLAALLLTSCAVSYADSATAQAHIDAGVALIEQGRDADAEREFRAAVEADRSLAKGHYNLGIVLHRLGKNEDAETALRVAVELQPDHGKAHYYLGKIMAATGRTDDAVSEFKAALSSDPQMAAAKLALERLHPGSADHSTANAATDDARTGAGDGGPGNAEIHTQALAVFRRSIPEDEWFEAAVDMLDVMWCRTGAGICSTSLQEWIRSDRRGFLVRKALRALPREADKSAVLLAAFNQSINEIERRIRAEVRFVNSGQKKLASFEARAGTGLYEHASALERAEATLAPKVRVIEDDLLRLQQALCGWGCTRIAPQVFSDGRSTVEVNEQELAAAKDRLPARVEVDLVPVILTAIEGIEAGASDVDHRAAHAAEHLLRQVLGLRAVALVAQEHGARGGQGPGQARARKRARGRERQRGQVRASIGVELRIGRGALQRGGGADHPPVAGALVLDRADLGERGALEGGQREDQREREGPARREADRSGGGGVLSGSHGSLRG